MHAVPKAVNAWQFNLAIEQRKDFWVTKDAAQDSFVLGRVFTVGRK